jgi:hypothetical protein
VVLSGVRGEVSGVAAVAGYAVAVIADAAQWRQADESEARWQAGLIAAQVEASSVTVRAHRFAGRRGWIALFDVAGSRFAFVPGGEVAVGYDAARFAGTPGQNASYAASAAEFGISLGIQEFIASVTSPARTAVVPPLLVSVTAAEAGLLPVPPGHPEITELLARGNRQGPAPGQIDWHRRARVTLDTDWTVTGAWLLQTPSCQQAAAQLFEAGQRLLTPDEWEHACGAGVTTLFRWGDSCPPGPGPRPAGTGPHREPNAFGLQIAQDPYRAERTADPAVACGGDGGGMICGGAGAFVSWLTLATAYRDPGLAGLLQENDGQDPGLYLRPAIAL